MPAQQDEDAKRRAKEAEARACVERRAEEWFRNPNTQNIDAQAWRKQIMLEAASSTADEWPRLIDDALDGDPDADAVLADEAQRFLERGEPLPSPLNDYVRLVLFDRFFTHGRKRRRGSDPNANVQRDYFIVGVLRRLETVEKLKPSRNRATAEKFPERECGCSIVADVLSLKEAAVAEVWRRRERLWKSLGISRAGPAYRG